MKTRMTVFLLTAALSASGAEVAITIDDPSPAKSAKFFGNERDEALRLHLQKAHLKAALFVCGMRVDNPEGKNLLKAWDSEGHMIGNHSYSHKSFNSAAVTTDFFKTDLLKSEALIAGLSHFEKFFRFPFLKEGATDGKRDGMRTFLLEHGYSNGAVTIDASDWYISERMTQRLEQSPNADVSGYRDFLLKHIWDRAVYYNDLSKRVLGREVKHTLLLHHNSLNAMFLGDLIHMFRSKNWKMIDASDAFKDPVFKIRPKILPAGESLIWALAKENPLHAATLRYPGEDGEYEKAEMDRLGL
jgi:peptidoglycan/xylan/chitin deacetylase (PgdA/CDA1 family)